MSGGEKKRRQERGTGNRSGEQTEGGVAKDACVSEVGSGGRDLILNSALGRAGRVII